METLYLKTAVLVLASALGYSLATIGMKLASSNWSLVALCLIVAGFVASTQAEVILMRGVNLSVLYLAIIAVETLVVLVYAASIGEGLTQRQMLGGVFVLTGLAVISSQAKRPGFSAFRFAASLCFGERQRLDREIGRSFSG